MITLLDYTIRMSIILGIALLLVRGLRRQSAALRHVVLASALFCAAILPIFNRALPSLTWSPGIDVDALPPQVLVVVRNSIASATTTLAAPVARVIPLQPAAAPVTDPAPAPAAAAPPRTQEFLPPPPAQRPVRVATVLRFVYLGGAALSFGALLLSLLRLWRVGFAARTLESPAWRRIAGEISQEYGLRCRLRLLKSHSPSVLATWGLFRPRIVIPAGSSVWAEDRIRVVLGHELAHVSRHDWLVQLCAEILRVVFWFNPLVWMIGRRLRQESEHACDDAVLNRGVSAPDYAAHLLDLARVLGNPRPAWAPALLMARPSTLEQRFHAMLNPRLKRSRVNRSSLVLTLGAFLCVAMPLAAFRAAPQAAVTETARATALSTASTVRSAVMAVLQVQNPAPVLVAPNSIEGIVVRLGSNEPISDVDVQLMRVEGTPDHPLGPRVAPAVPRRFDLLPPNYVGPGPDLSPTSPDPSDIANVRTKVDGRFVFTKLKPGTYRLQAARAGGAYFPAEYGQRSPKGKGYDFQFVEEQSLRGVRLEMLPTGSISGRVIDDAGQPAARVRVMALEAAYSRGDRTLGIVQAVQTNDNGEYRLFWLPPGEYVIAARQEDPRRHTLQLFITPPGSTDGREMLPQAPLTFRTLEDGAVIEETFETVYYGGDPDVKKARSVALPPGGNLNGIDLSLAGNRVRTRRVRGVLSDPSRARVPGVTVIALPRNSGPSMVAPSAVTDANGTFELSGVGTGAYILSAGTFSLTGPTTFVGFGVLGPGDSDVEGVTISVSQRFSVQGKIVVDGREAGAALPDLSKVSVRLENSIPMLPPAFSTAVNGGAFTINARQAGDYRVLVDPFMATDTSDPNRPVVPADLQNAYIKAIRMNAGDGLNGPMNIAPGPGQLEIVLAMNGGAVEGVVTDRQQPAANTRVVLVPSVRSRADLYRVVNSGGDGRFRMQGIPPGDYKIFSWDYVEDGAWHNAEFLRTHESSGKALRITEGSKTDLSLTMERS